MSYRVSSDHAGDVVNWLTETMHKQAADCCDPCYIEKQDDGNKRPLDCCTDRCPLEKVKAEFDLGEMMK